MPQYNRQQLETALRGADAAGDVAAAQKLAQALRSFQSPGDLSTDPLITDPLSLIPGQGQPEPQVEQTTSLMDKAKGVFDEVAGARETIGTVATGMTGGTVGMVGGFLKGLAEEVRAGNFGTAEAADRIEQASMEGAEALTRTPRTEAGQRQTQAVGEFAQKLMPFAGLAGEINALSSTIARGGKMRPGTRLIDDAGQPTVELQKSLNKKGLVFENLTPEARAMVPSVAGKKLVRSQVKGPIEQTLIEQIKTGGTDDSLAPIMIQRGRIAPDPLGQEAIKQGFEKGFVQSVKAANPATKKGFDQMLTLMQRIKSNRSVALDQRLTNITGNAFAKRIEFIRDTANKARTDLNKIARVKLHNQPIDTQPVVQRLTDSFKSLDITEVKNVKGKLRPVYEKTMISKDRTSQKVINDLLDLMAEDVNPDALRFHKMKRQLDTMIDYRKKSVGGLTDAGKNVLKDVRSALNDSLREVNPDYARVNDILSRSLGSIDDLQKATGPSIKLIGESAPRALGQDLRRLMGNTKTRVKLDDAVRGIDDLASDLGGKFDDNVGQLAQFANLIEDRFGEVASSSFKGEISSAIKQAGQQGVKESLAQAAITKGAEGLEALRGINDFNAFRAMRELINRDL